jgi:putative cell wall-binding protein
MRILLYFILICIIGLLAIPTAFAQDNNSTDPLVRVLVTKGVITTEEARAITSNASPAEQRDR